MNFNAEQFHFRYEVLEKVKYFWTHIIHFLPIHIQKRARRKKYVTFFKCPINCSEKFNCFRLKPTIYRCRCWLIFLLFFEDACMWMTLCWCLLIKRLIRTVGFVRNYVRCYKLSSYACVNLDSEYRANYCVPVPPRACKYICTIARHVCLMARSL